MPEPLSQQTTPAVGDTRIVFDADAWTLAGYDQPNGNAQFYRPAKIIKLYKTRLYRELVADVRFLHDNRVSHAHFVDGMKLP